MTPINKAKWFDFNVNYTVMVQLTEKGRWIHRKEMEEIMGVLPGWEYKAPKEDEDGWSEWQMWILMRTFGPHISMGSMPPFNTGILIKNPPGMKAPSPQLMPYASSNDPTVHEMLKREAALEEIIETLSKQKQACFDRIMELESIAPRKITLPGGKAMV